MRYTIIFFFIIINTFLLSGQDITFQTLTPENGLSQISVNDLYEDERGFIWIGTREGVNCYNGNSIETYKFQKDNPNSLFSNNILKITGDKNGKVFLLCVDGVAEWDMKKEKFTTILEAPNVTAVYYNKALFVGKGNEIFILGDNHELELFYRLPQNDDEISALFIDNEEMIWAATSNHGLYKINKTSGEVVHLIEKANITGLFEDADGDIWSGSWEHGLYRIKDKKEVVRYLHNAQKNSISSNFVRTCCQDNQGNLWIGTFAGLDKLDKQTEEFSHYSTEINSSGMTHHSIWGMIKDHQGTIWFGTYFGGVNYFNPDYEIYTHYKVSNEKGKGLSSPIVGKMTEDDKGNLWICTEGGGVNVYNRKTKTFNWYQHDKNRNSISHNNVKSIYFDSDNKIMWIGTHLGGLNKLDLRTNVFTHYRPIENDTTSLPSDIIRDIIPYKNNLIIATQNGVCLFFPETGKCRQMFKDTEEGRLIKMVADLFIDYYGTLWIAATGDGVFSYDFEEDKLTHYKYNPSDSGSISNNNINNIAQDHYYNLWFSTSGSGLDLFDYKTGKFTNFDSQKNGLASDCIYEVCESRYGKLLLITNQGFSQFDHSDNIFYNYNRDTGFPLSSINENALYLTNDGEVFLGGVQGMVSFYEKDLQFSKKSYNIIPYRITVNNTPVTIDDNTDILRTSLYSYPNIELKSKYSVFSIEFAATNYIPANKDKIVYKLEGFSQDWINANNQNIITYTNLNPGKYTLVIKAEDSGLSDTPEARINITVLPPFYKTIYAYLLYIVIAAVILYFIVKSYNGRIKLQESLKYEQKHIQDIEMLNQSKLRFFTNISHEFRTPLTLIIGQIEMLMQIEPFTPKVYNKLLSVYKNSLQMRGLITELLDFRKQEQGHMTIKVSEHNIVDFLKENYLLFLEYSNTRDIKLIFNKEIDVLNVWFDSKQIQKVLNNLLSNAFKYTKAGDEVSISIKQDNDCAVLEVKDTGEGIDSQDLDKIFNRFYQTSDTATGTGIGLALSKGIVELHSGRIIVESNKDKGSTFKVYLPLGKGHFTEEQIIEQELIVKEEILSETIDSSLLDDIPVMDVQTKIEGAKMLIVEDNEALREMLVRIFEPFYCVISAVDGEEGLGMLKKEMPSIILSDVLMPRMSGVELCKEVKNDIETCHIPVVLLTARTAVEHTIEGLQNGADDYITKPFNINVLVSRCNNLVNSRIVLQEKFSQQPQMTPLMLATNRLDKEMIDKVVDIVNSNITNPDFNVDQLADELFIARTSLYTKIKAITGQTPNKFILTIRLKKAAFLLRNNPELRISEISDMTGFTSSGYFGKCFKEIYHTTPLAYRTGVDDSESTD
ncbi:response regulator [Dysgonomonas sp. OttesenSCG-928-M03]|nr:response regulator [Dysgonomonas sp. OttesenSCG-928-M03]